MSTFIIAGFVLLVLNTVVGMVANGFIVLFISIDWVRSRKLSPTDLILGCLGLSRFLWHVVVILIAVLSFFFNITYLQNYMVITISTMWVFMNSVNLWFAAWLSILYFVKVAIFSHPVFLQVKRGFSGLVPWLLLGSVVFSAAVTIITITILTYFFSVCPSFQSLPHNCSDSAIQSFDFCSDSAIQSFDFCSYYVLLINASSIIPFMLFLLSSIFLISSLWKHLRRMQHNGISIKELNTQAHLTAIKALASFAVLYLFSFVAVILQAEQLLNYVHPWTAIVFENVSSLYPSGHAIILILINPKLKQGWVKMLHHFKYCLSEVSS